MTDTYRILAINPGSTSTKVALFENHNRIISVNVAHDASRLGTYADISDQLPYRRAVILEELEKNGIRLDTIDAFVGRGGGLAGLAGGTYRINDILLDHARAGFTVKHPAILGSQLAHEFAGIHKKPSFVVDPPDVDEFEPLARITGLSRVYRESRGHPLNQKEAARRYAAETGRKYEEMNLVISHLGGGVSVTAHQRGRMVDSTDVINGDGPMAPTRAGALPAMAVIRMCFSGRYTEAGMYRLITKSGGLVDHLGTADAREIRERMGQGDRHAGRIYDAMAYQVAKSIGAYATVLRGEVDGILLTGGMAHDTYLTNAIAERVSYIAPVRVFPGEFEMEALASGALRVLTGQEEPKTYTGIPVWENPETA
ncbi:MAG: butyrate kinase [Pseudomonadota bacterium]